MLKTENQIKGNAGSLGEKSHFYRQEAEKPLKSTLTKDIPGKTKIIPNLSTKKNTDVSKAFFFFSSPVLKIRSCYRRSVFHCGLILIVIKGSLFAQQFWTAMVHCSQEELSCRLPRKEDSQLELSFC
jgi:hypothetical protein